MLILRLQRIGKKKQGSYRLIVSEKRRDTQAGSLEILGVYDPVTTPKVVNLKKDRIEYWLSHGAQTSATVHNLLVSAGLVSGKKRRVVKLSTKRRASLAKAKSEAAPAAPPAGAAV